MQPKLESVCMLRENSAGAGESQPEASRMGGGPMLVLRNLMRRKLRTVFSVIGVGVGMSLMVTMFSMSSDMLAQIRSLLNQARGDVIVSEGTGTLMSSMIPLTDENGGSLIKRLETMDNVESAHPHIEAFMNVQRRIAGGSTLVYYGVTPGSPVLEAIRPALDENGQPLFTEPGEPLMRKGDDNGFIVGKMLFDLANERLPPEKRLKIGQRLNLSNLLIDEFADYFVPEDSNFSRLSRSEQYEAAKRVLREAKIDPIAAMEMNDLYLRAVVESDQRIAETIIYFPLKRAQELTSRENKAGVVLLTLADNSDSALNTTVEDLNTSISGLYFERSDTFLDTIDDIQLVQNFMLGISIVAAIAGALGVLNIMVMSVHERTREIGLLLAIGWSRGRIVRGVIVEGLIVTFFGGLMGIIFGEIVLLGIREVMALKVLDAWVDPVLCLYALILALVLGALASLYPAWRASRLTPMDALRTE